MGDDYPVAIVGAGPTGLTLSLLLSKLGEYAKRPQRPATRPEHKRLTTQL
jgi:flavin-dependent dehydrogenase